MCAMESVVLSKTLRRFQVSDHNSESVLKGVFGKLLVTDLSKEDCGDSDYAAGLLIFRKQ